MMLEENGMERYVQTDKKEFSNFLQDGERKTPKRSQVLSGYIYMLIVVQV